MKSLGCCLFLVATQTFAAAPDSIAGKVYRSYQLLSGVSNAAEESLVLGNDGRYIVLKSALGVVHRPGPPDVLPEVHWGAIQDPAIGGRFSYERTGESTGVM